MSTPKSEPPLVACPTCRRQVAYATSNPWRPFCTQRCRQVDLGAWATESYRVAQVDEGDGGDNGDTSAGMGGADLLPRG